MHACEVGKTNPTKWIQQENFRLSHFYINFNLNCDGLLTFFAAYGSTLMLDIYISINLTAVRT